MPFQALKPTNLVKKGIHFIVPNKKGEIVAKNNDLKFFISLIVIVSTLYIVFNTDFGKNIQSTILPELDNRIDYISQDIPMQNLIVTGYANGNKIWENEKLTCIQGVGGSEPSIFSIAVNAECTVKKDFSRLNLFFRAAYNSGAEIHISGYAIDNPDNSFKMYNYEIVPDNLNIGIYNIFKDGEFFKRITIPDDRVIIRYVVRNGASVKFEYIKYVPIETFTIKNDEVWVKEVRGSDYSIDNLNWEMIGYHTQIRPATIRDLTQQTEVPTPQIYINLINGLPVEVQPNTVHTFFYKTKWTEGLDSSCKGDLDKVQIEIADGVWQCQSYVKETPIIQQCQTKNDCPILPECEAQRNLIECIDNLCVYDDFTPECKNQLITYQEKVIEIEQTKFVPLPSGLNQFFCFFDIHQTSCKVGEKTILASVPKYVCSSSETQSDSCWATELSFDGNDFYFKNNEKKSDIGYNITAEISMSALLDENKKVKNNWVIVGKFTLPDNFLELKTKVLGNKFLLQNSVDKITFTITNKLFGMDGGYTLQTQNLALEGGTIIRNEINNLYLPKGDTDVTYNFKTSQLGTIIDIIGVFGKITTDREYIMKSSKEGKEKFLVLTKEIRTELLPQEEIEKLEPTIIEEEIKAPIMIKEEPTEIPTFIKVFGIIAGLFLLLKVFRII